MSQQILIKRSGVQSKVPLTSDIVLGELALNTYDGKLYMRKNDGTLDTIIEIGAGATAFAGDVTGTNIGGTATLSLVNSGVTAGTYTKVAVDAKGRVVNGTQIISSDVTTALGFTPINTNKIGAVSGLATLDTNSKLTASQIPSSLVGAVVYQGNWNASTNVPTLVSSSGTKGWYYKVTTAGSAVIDGLSQWNIGDLIIFNGTTWDKIDGAANQVLSVFGRTGAVVLLSSDVSTALGFTPLSTNQTISITGAATGSGTTSIALTLADSGVGAGTYTKVTVNAKGLITSATTMASADVTTSLGYTPVNPNQLNVSNGIATLGSDGKLLASQIPAVLVGAVVYQGTWNASTNTPTLTSGVGTKGQYYKVSVAGTTNINTINNWYAGDIIIYDGSAWSKIDGVSDEVLSVAGRTGIVTLTTADVTEGANLYYTNARASAAAPVQSVFGRTGAVVLGSSDVTSALGFTPIAGNQSITISGDVTGSGTTTIALTLANSGVTTGTYTKVTVDAKGRVTTGASLLSTDITTVLGYTPVNPASATLSGTPTAPTAAANTSTTQIATTAYVNKMSSSLSGFSFVNTNTTLTAANTGSGIQIGGSSTITLTMPVGSTLWSGALFYIVNHSSANQTISFQGSDYIYDPPSISNTTTQSISIAPGDTMILMSRGTTEYDLLGGSISAFRSASPTFTSPVTSSFFYSSVSAAVAAAGTTQGTGTALTSSIAVVTSGTGGVILPTAVAGMLLTVVNTTGSAINVYPASGASIDALSANTTFSLGTLAKLEFVAVSATKWYALTAVYA